MPGWGEMMGNGLQGWWARERTPDGIWVAQPDHTWLGAVEVELDPADDHCLWVKRGSGNLASSDDGRTADLFSRAELGSCELYLEFFLPVESSSGVFMLGQYEIELADTSELTDDELSYDSSGGIQSRWDPVARKAFDGHSPLVNAALPAGEWNTLEIVFRAPRFDDAGAKTANARFDRVVLNDQLIHENVELTGPTRGAALDHEVPRGPVRLQGDRGPVAFRDVRMKTIFE